MNGLHPYRQFHNPATINHPIARPNEELMDRNTFDHVENICFSMVMNNLSKFIKTADNACLEAHNSLFALYKYVFERMFLMEALCQENGLPLEGSNEVYAKLFNCFNNNSLDNSPTALYFRSLFYSHGFAVEQDHKQARNYMRMVLSTNSGQPCHAKLESARRLEDFYYVQSSYLSGKKKSRSEQGAEHYGTLKTKLETALGYGGLSPSMIYI